MASPLLVGAVTVVVTILAVFLSYNAGSGLPFVPTYNVSVQLPDTQELVPNNDVLVGGRRVGVIDAIEAKLDAAEHPIAELQLRLEKPLEGEVLSDATARVRSRSVLGAKYLELKPGRVGEPLAAGETLPIERARENVELDEVVDELDGETRADLKAVLNGFGTGFASRGADFNASFERLRPLVDDAQPIFSDLASPATRLGPQIRALAATTAELAPASAQLVSLLRGGATTLEALEAAGPEFERAIEQTPATLETGESALATLSPVLARTDVIARRISPAIQLLPETATQLASAVETGTPVLSRAYKLGPLLEPGFVELRGLAVDEPTKPALDSLAGVLPRLQPAVEHLAPYQTVCNYVALGSRNLASTVSEGSASGNWLRFTAILEPSEMLTAEHAAPQLHFNPYPNGAAPGQPHECEGGNETYIPGQQIGNVPGNQGTTTDQTTPESIEAVTGP
jgi:virulence factor Mce-like protein